jgi:basic membrane lipoprotein Med (substrate-binding protein (PBP1-ABC) superfamily)
MSSHRTTLAAVFLAAAAVGCAQVAEGSEQKVLVVLGGKAARSPALIEAAQHAVAAAGDPDVQLRVPQTSTEELGVTHMAAARHYDTVIAVGLDRRVSVEPVAQRYPAVRFVEATADADALRRALGAR